MSSTTTNLGLTLPTGSENWQRSIINGNFEKIDEALGGKQYNLGALSSATIADQAIAFANAHKQEQGITGTFYITASAAPSDLPAQTNEWKYAYGKFVMRLINSAGVADGEIILFGFNSSNIMVRYIANSVVASSWSQLAPYAQGTWTPHLYDLDTKLRDLPTGNYYKIGKFVMATIYADSPNLSGISTMMQIRNVPMDFVIGGMFYLANLTSGQGANQTIQGSREKVYFRPNILSSQINNPSSAGVFTLTIFGYMD